MDMSFLKENWQVESHTGLGNAVPPRGRGLPHLIELSISTPPLVSIAHLHHIVTHHVCRRSGISRHCRL